MGLVSAVVYGASPIDLIPDLLLVLGWVDDAFAIPLFLLFSAVSFYRWRKGARRPSAGGTVVPTSAREAVPPVIADSYEAAVGSQAR